MSTRCLALLLVALTVAGHAYAQQPADPVPLGTPGLTPPRLTTQVTVEYPSIAMAARVGGTVVVETTVDDAGRVQRAAVVQPSGAPLLLDKSAVDAVRLMQFSPAILDGAPVPVIVPVTFRFTVGIAATRPRPTSPPASPASWVPPDFAVAYAYQCPVSEFTIDTARGLEAIFLRLVRAGFFLVDEGVTMWRDPGTHVFEGELGVEVFVAGEVVRIRIVTNAPVRRSFVHELDVRYFGVWRRIAWSRCAGISPWR